MGGYRETKNIFWHIKVNNYKGVWRLIKNFDRMTYDDTFMPIICKIKGHKPYQQPNFEPNEWGCKRCNRYIDYNPRLEKLKRLKKLANEKNV